MLKIKWVIHGATSISDGVFEERGNDEQIPAYEDGPCHQEMEDKKGDL